MEDNTNSAIVAMSELIIAYAAGAAAPCGYVMQSADLAGMTLVPGK